MGGRGSGSSNNKRFFIGGNEGGGYGNDKRHFTAEANVQIKTKTYEEALRVFSKNFANAGHEYAYEVNSDGFVHQFVEGKTHSVAIAGKNKGIVIHNHPSGSNFSKADLLTNAINKNEAGVVAVGKEYTYTFVKNGGHFKESNFVSDFGNLKSVVGKSRDDGLHRWLKANQKKYGYTYTRIKSPSVFGR